MLRVVYSNGARFAGGGIGDRSYHAVAGLLRHGVLERLLCGSYRGTEIPPARIRSMGAISRVLRKAAARDPAGRIDHLYRALYDRWASRRLLPCEVYLGFTGYGVRTMLRAKAAHTTVVLDREIAHPVYLQRVMEEERVRWGLPSRDSWMTEVVRREIELADHVLVASEFVRETFVEAGVAAERLTRIPFGVDLARFHPAPHPAADPFVVLFVGQVSIRKGVPDLLEAWRLLGWQRAELWLAGRITLPATLLARFAKLRGVRFLGHTANVEALYRQGRVFVLPSLAEGSARVSYEAMASGLPVVVTPNTGAVARDGADGYVVPIRDPQAIASRLEALRADDALRARMGRSARKRAESFSWDRYGDRIVETLYRLAGHPHP